MRVIQFTVLVMFAVTAWQHGVIWVALLAAGCALFIVLGAPYRT